MSTWTAWVLGAAWAAVVVTARLRTGVVPARVRALAATPTPTNSGGHAHARAGFCPPEPASASPNVAFVAVLAVAVFAVAPPLGLALLLAGWAVPRARRRRASKHAQALVDADLPEVVDLLRMCVGAGLTVPLAVEAVARRAEGPVARALADAVAQADGRGVRLADALEEVPARLGESTRSLVGVLVGSERYGHAIGPALERLAGECRADERRRAEAHARRVPVLLLFPLVTCILPAFALLTVAPLIAGALRALRL